MNAFEKALLQAVNDDFSHVPAEEELNTPPISMKKAVARNVLRRSLLVAVICVLLTGTVLAAYVIQYRIGQVDIETDATKIFSFVSESDDDGNNYHQITFTENFANPNAPDKIETFYLPEVDVRDVELSKPYWSVSSTDYGYYQPFADSQLEYNETDPKDYEKILAAPARVYYTWNAFVGDQISFSQSLAKEAVDGTSFMTMSYARDGGATAYTETVEIDGYSIFAFNIDWSEKEIAEGEYGAVSRNWFWTDGDYVFVLESRLSMEEMTELFRSVHPVGTSYPYDTVS